MTSAAPELSDEYLAASALAGSGAAFELIVRRYQRPLLHYLQSITRDRHEAEDALQNAFVKLHQSMARYDSRWPFRAWAFMIAHREAMNCFRRRPKRLMARPRGASESPADSVARADDRARLWDVARATLSADQYTAVWLYYVEDAAVTDIARVLEKSASAVKVMLHRARAALGVRLVQEGNLIAAER